VFDNHRPLRAREILAVRRDPQGDGSDRARTSVIVNGTLVAENATHIGALRGCGKNAGGLRNNPLRE
jgi:hypothetical protein